MNTPVTLQISNRKAANDLFSMTRLAWIKDLLSRAFYSYGSFFGLKSPISKLMIAICTMLNPQIGLFGLLGALSTASWRKVLGLPPAAYEQIELVNGILIGLLIGTCYSADARTVLLTIFGCLEIVMLSAVLNDTLTKSLKLPLLGLPYGLSAYTIIPIATFMGILPAPVSVSALTPILNLTFPGAQFLPAIGAIYFNGTAIGGLIVLAAFLISSPYLALIALASSVLCWFFLNALGADPLSLNFLIAQMNGVLTATVIGGFYAMPGKRSLSVAAVAALFACAFTIVGQRLLVPFGLPTLALPFVITTYVALLGFRTQHTGPWLNFWLPRPMLAEQSIEQVNLAAARGIDARSIALKTPFLGAWQVYQGFSGPHTHQPPWEYALDFFRTKNGKSFSGNGRELTDYHSFGRPVLSPAYGRVIDLRNDVKDNQPGEVDIANNWGNYILIELACGSYVLLAHLQRGSIRVQRDSRLIPGELVALCGNSGRSPQPHLHMHVQETAQLGSRTLPFHLTDVVLPNTSEIDSTDNQLYSLHARPAELDTVGSPSRNTAMKKALHLCVGNWFEYHVIENGEAALRRFEVKLDVYGQFYLESDLSAKVSFVQTDDLVSFFDRNDQPDLALDAFILALGLTPFTEGSLTWHDAIPRRWLPVGAFAQLAARLLSPFSGCANSTYHRKWDPQSQLWAQRATHKLFPNAPAFWQSSTESQLCESAGLLSVKMMLAGRTLVEAKLAGLGLREDNGIPAKGTPALSPPPTPARCHEGNHR